MIDVIEVGRDIDICVVFVGTSLLSNTFFEVSVGTERRQRYPFYNSITVDLSTTGAAAENLTISINNVIQKEFRYGIKFYGPTK